MIVTTGLAGLIAAEETGNAGWCGINGMPVALLILPFHPAMGIMMTYQPQIVTDLLIDGLATDQTARNIVSPQGQRGCSSEPETIARLYIQVEVMEGLVRVEISLTRIVSRREVLDNAVHRGLPPH